MENYQRIRKLFAPIAYPDPVKNRQSGTLNIVLLILLVSSFITVLAGLPFVLGEPKLGIVLILSSASFFVFLCLVILSRFGFLQTCSLFTNLFLLAVASYSLYTGDGLHDIAIMMFPVLLLIAGLLLQKFQYILITLLVLLIIALIGIFELQGYIINKYADLNSPIDVVLALIFIGATAILVRFLTENLLKALATTQKNELNYRRIFNATSETIFILDAQTKNILDVNISIEPMFGYTKAEICKFGFKELSSGIHPYSSDELDRRINKLNAKQPQLFEWQVKHNDGNLFWVEISLRSTEIDGEDRFLGVIRDISNRKNLEDTLHKEKLFNDAIVDSLPGIFFIYKDGQELIRWNKNHETRTGFNSEEMKGKDPLDWFDKSNKENVKNIITQLASTKESLTIESNLINKNLSETPYLFSIRFINIDGRDYLIGTGTDITKRKQTEDALKESERNLKRAQRISKIGVWYYDWDSNEEIWSDECFEIFGLNKEDYPDHLVPESLSFSFYEDPEKFKGLSLSLAQVQDSFKLEFRTTPINGKVKTIQSYSEVERGADGKIKKIFGFDHDVTEQQQMKDALKKSHDDLERKVEQRTRELQESLSNLEQTQEQLVRSERLAALGNMVAGIAHEINTPLGIGVTESSHLNDMALEIKAMFDSNSLTSSKFEKFIILVAESSSSIFKSLRRSAELIRSFKQVAVDQTTIDRRRFFVKDYINGLILSLRSELKHTKHSIDVTCPEELTIESYPGAFSQILTNFILNSLNHGFDKIESGKIEIEIQKNDNSLFFNYRDNGVGMSEETRSQIFDPFFTTKRNQGGTGLGMNIVYNLVSHKLQGHIECNSSLGNGVEFIIEIPLDD